MQMLISIFLALILLCSPAFADDDDTVVVGCPAGVDCNPASNEVGTRTNLATSSNWTVNVPRCGGPYTPDCSGTLRYPSMYHVSGHDHIKIAVFLDDGDEVTDSGDTLVGNWSPDISAVDVDDDNSWVTGTTALTGSVSTGSKYWVCSITSAEAWQGTVGALTGYKRCYCSGCSWDYADPETTLDPLANSDPDGVWDCDTTNQSYSVYVEVD